MVMSVRSTKICPTLERFRIDWMVFRSSRQRILCDHFIWHFKKKVTDTSASALGILLGIKLCSTIRRRWDKTDRHRLYLCLNLTTTHSSSFQFMQAYHNRRPQFAFSFHGELSHDSINLVGVADADVKEWLEGLQNSGFLNRTILIMMADHGNR